ncbi:MAG TPA: DUF6159 family protein [Anaerolineae bacterium]|nr:DUF6159 family protein [Anaerolineae bacterium]
MSRLSNSWELVKESWKVLRADKELLIFPIVSMIGSIIVTIAFMVPIFLSRLYESFSGESSGNKIAFVAFMFLFYVVEYTVIFFCNAALVGAAMIRLKGGDPTLRDGFRIASQHFGAIIGYAIISSTVGMILRAIAERGIIGQIVSGFIGFAWNVATYIAVPILVVEGVGPIEAVKRSTAYLKKTWGERIIGNAGIGLVFGLIIFLIILLGVPAMIALASTKSIGLIAFGGILLVTIIIGLGLIASALTGIYTAAVYRYAAEGATDGFFDPNIVQNTFRQK